MAVADSPVERGAEAPSGLRVGAALLAGLLAASNAGANIPRVPFQELAPAAASTWVSGETIHASATSALKFVTESADEHHERAALRIASELTEPATPPREVKRPVE